ncbi:MAG: hypothetical protein WDN06_07360 [Asticcacaulis sp.]
MSAAEQFRQGDLLVFFVRRNDVAFVGLAVGAGHLGRRAGGERQANAESRHSQGKGTHGRHRVITPHRFFMSAAISRPRFG